MQEQNFEKGVREKMEELSFVPSEPVWQKVEEQIRKKKERRRVIFWVLPFLLLCGGIYFWTKSDKTDEPNLASGTNRANQSKKPIIEEKHIVQKSTLEKTTTVLKEKSQDNETSIPAEEIVRRTHNKNRAQNTGLKRHLFHKDQVAVSTNRSEQETTTVKKYPEIPKETMNTDVVSSAITKIEEENATPTDAGFADTTAHTKDANNITATTTGDTTAVADSTEEKEKNIPTPSADTAQAKPASKKVLWSWSIHSSGGYSGIATSAFNFLPVASSGVNNDALTFNAASQAVFNGAPAPVQMSGSPETYRGLSFSVGGIVERKLFNRVNFTTGLQYRYYSTHNYIGKKINSTTLVTRENKQHRINNFYANTNFGKEEYTNRYHFIEIPVGLRWQVLKRHPLQLHSGFSITRLVATNALYYDSQQSIFYEDEKIFRKMQYGVFTDISYRFLKIKSIAFYAGPQIQLGLSNLLKKEAYGKQHLFFAGINTRVAF